MTTAHQLRCQCLVLTNDARLGLENEAFMDSPPIKDDP